MTIPALKAFSSNSDSHTDETRSNRGNATNNERKKGETSKSPVRTSTKNDEETKTKDSTEHGKIRVFSKEESISTLSNETLDTLNTIIHIRRLRVISGRRVNKSRVLHSINRSSNRNSCNLQGVIKSDNMWLTSAVFHYLFTSTT